MKNEMIVIMNNLILIRKAFRNSIWKWTTAGEKFDTFPPTRKNSYFSKVISDLVTWNDAWNEEIKFQLNYCSLIADDLNN